MRHSDGSAAAARRSATRKRILLISDRPAEVQLLRGMLAAHGHRVLHAESGLRGLDLAREWHPHLIVMDLADTMSALEITQTLKASDDTGKIPILVTAPQAKAYQETVQHNLYIADPKAATVFVELIDLLIKRTKLQHQSGRRNARSDCY